MATPFADSVYYMDNGFGTPPEDANALLERASRLLRAECSGVDARIADYATDPTIEGALDPDVVADVVCEMVQNYAAASTPGVGVESNSQQFGSGPFQMTNTAKYSTPTGAMILNRKHRRLLGCSTQRAFSIDLDPQA